MFHLKNKIGGMNNLGYLILLLISAFVLLTTFSPQYNHVISTVVSNYETKVQDSFHKNYYQTWGEDHFKVTKQGLQVRLQLNQYSGAGFSSKLEFGSGHFKIKLKLPENVTPGVVTTFYLMELPVGHPVEGVNHFEFDIEFMGKNLSTNVFANDLGHREQFFNLWFDPSADFHQYEILWNKHHIVWFVDGEPVRVWKNVSTHLGVGFPAGPMHVEASIWNASFAGKVDWSNAPFTVYYRGFDIHACVYRGSGNSSRCFSDDEKSYYWNGEAHRQLNSVQEAQLARHRKDHMYYDYCDNKKEAFPECRVNH